MTVYQKRLSEEAKILKDLHHPNIVGKYVFKILHYNGQCKYYKTNIYLNDLFPVCF